MCVNHDLPRMRLLNELHTLLQRNWTVTELLWGMELKLDDILVGHETNQNVFEHMQGFILQSERFQCISVPCNKIT